MAPKQDQKFTMRDLTSRDKSPAVKAVFDQVLVDAYKEQQKILKKAAKIKQLFAGLEEVVEKAGDGEGANAAGFGSDSGEVLAVSNFWCEVAF